MNGMPIFRGEHCVYSCVHPCRRMAEREGYLSTRTLPVFPCSAALSPMRGDLSDSGTDGQVLGSWLTEYD